jgi:hypothetical protein
LFQEQETTPTKLVGLFVTENIASRAWIALVVNCPPVAWSKPEAGRIRIQKIARKLISFFILISLG